MVSYTFKVIVIILTGLLVLFTFVITMLEGGTQELMRVEETECYDKFSNEIEGLVCEREIMCGIISKKVSKDYCYGGRR